MTIYKLPKKLSINQNIQDYDLNLIKMKRIFPSTDFFAEPKWPLPNRTSPQQASNLPVLQESAKILEKSLNQKDIDQEFYIQQVSMQENLESDRVEILATDTVEILESDKVEMDQCQEQMFYSNLKHSEVTYLGESQKPIFHHGATHERNSTQYEEKCSTFTSNKFSLQQKNMSQEEEYSNDSSDWIKMDIKIRKIVQSRQRQKSSKKYAIFDQQMKEYLVRQSALTGVSEVARRYNISVNNICRWKKGCFRKIGAGRKIKNQILESGMVTYIQDAIGNGDTLTRKSIMVAARNMSGDPNFKASKGWFQRFQTRNLHKFQNARWL